MGVSHSARIMAAEQVTVLKRWFSAKGVAFPNSPANTFLQSVTVPLHTAQTAFLSPFCMAQMPPQ